VEREVSATLDPPVKQGNHGVRFNGSDQAAEQPQGQNQAVNDTIPTPIRIRWSQTWKENIDDVDVKTADDQGRNPFRQPQYLLINLALGGSSGGKIDDSVLLQRYLIDYDRVHQKQDASP